jgi:rsbT antagonist protein RsbS
VAIALVEEDLEIPGVVTALNLERAVEMLAPSQEDEVPTELASEVPNEEPS